MDTTQTQVPTLIENADYLKIWEVEQEQMRTRWTITTYFISISFAILGFSFQTSLTHTAALALRICGLFVYWFGFIFFMRYYAQSNYLRTYLLELEKTHRTTLDIQSRGLTNRKDFLKAISTPKLMIGFGLLYAVSIVVFFILKV